MPATSECRVCGGAVQEFIDFGRQPLSDAFLLPGSTDGEFFYRLAVGVCGSCSMVQLMEEVPRERMFHEEYPYYSSGSAGMRNHFEATARRFLETELRADDAFIVEIGCNDGVLLRTIADQGRRHLGVEPSGGVADVAASQGIEVRKDFFEESTARSIAEAHGKADVIFAANTFCHIPYIDSMFRGITALLAPTGVFVFEDPYLGDIVEKASFDQVYDEHFFYFCVQSVQRTAERFGMELVDVERLPVHGGELRYTLAHRGAREVSASVVELARRERELGICEPSTLRGFAERVEHNRDRLVELLRDLRGQGKRIVAYGATAKSATVTNYCGIDTGLVEFVCDTTPAKQGRLTPGAHLPVRGPEAFATPYPDYALLFAWNHAEEIMRKEEGFRAAGGKWITYVPEVGTG